MPVSSSAVLHIGLFRVFSECANIRRGIACSGWKYAGDNFEHLHFSLAECAFFRDGHNRMDQTA